jgi:hypothetical protein
MNGVTSTRNFSETLSTLPLSVQRRIGAEFVAAVLHLAHDHRLEQALMIAKKEDSAADQLQAAYRMAYAVYVETSPQSGFDELDLGRQAAHFVAEACMTCVAPTYHEARVVNLAQKVAMYCRMAVTCFHIPHEQEEALDFSHAAQEVQKLIDDQHAILKKYLNK